MCADLISVTLVIDAEPGIFNIFKRLLIQESLMEMMRTSFDERPTKKMKTRSCSKYYLIGPSKHCLC